MKRIKNLIVMTLATVSILLSNAVNAKDDTPIDFNQLPQKAQMFINTHFSANDIMMAKIDREVMSKVYVVKLKNGTEIDFTKDGEWLEVDCGNNKVPDSVVAPNILAKVKQMYPNEFIKEIKKLKSWTEITLSNGFEVTLDKNLKIIEVD